MHELSIALSLLELVEEHSHEHEHAHVTAIHLNIGPLSGVVPQALTSAYDLAKEQTSFTDTALEITETVVTAYCPTCRCTRSIVSLQDVACAVCHTPTPDILTGKELEVTALEITE